MKNRFFTFISVAVSLLLFSFTFSACDDDCETIYEGYGLVNKLSDNKFSVTLDDGMLLYPREYWVNPSELHDSTRLYMQFNVIEEKDSCAYVRLTYVDTILTKDVIPYEESILDSLGNDPIKITNHWFAHGFLNFEFMFAGRVNLGKTHAHMVNLLQCPAEGEKLVFEFRHNDFDDNRDKVYIGVVSFPIEKVVEGLKKPIKMEVRFKDSENSTRSIDLIYK